MRAILDDPPIHIRPVVPANAGAKAKNPVGSTLFSTPIIAFLRHSGHQILRTCCRESARKRLNALRHEPSTSNQAIRLEPDLADAEISGSAVTANSLKRPIRQRFGFRLAAKIRNLCARGLLDATLTVENRL